MQNPFDVGFYTSDELRTFGFAHVGDNVQIAKNCVIVGLPNIWLGDHIRIDAFTSIIATGTVRLGSYIHIGTSCMIGARGGFELAGFGGMSHGVKVFTASDDFSGHTMLSCNVADELKAVQIAPVRIGLHCSIGANSTVLPGCDFEDGAVLGAQSLAVRPLSGWATHFGTPARKVSGRSQRCVALADGVLQREVAA